MLLALLIGIILGMGGFLAIFIIQLILKGKFAYSREKNMLISVIIVLTVMMLFPRLLRSFSLGSLFICVGVIMTWLVPRFEIVKKIMQYGLFAGQDLNDPDSPFAKIIDLFRYPIIFLGVYVMFPDALILLDIVPVAMAIWWCARKLREAAIVQQDN